MTTDTRYFFLSWPRLLALMRGNEGEKGRAWVSQKRPVNRVQEGKGRTHCFAATSTVLAIVLRTFPSSKQSSPAIVHPPGVVT